MKSLLYLSLGFFLFINYKCHPQANEKILGSWCYCTKDGQYHEYHFMENEFDIFTSDSEGELMGEHFHAYVIRKDSLISVMYGSTHQNDSIRATLEFLSQDQVLIINKRWTINLNRMQYSYQPPLNGDREAYAKWRDQYEIGFNKRSKKRNCLEVQILNPGEN